MHFGKREILELLKERGVEHEVIEHEAVFTMQEMEQLHMDGTPDVAKNLFARDPKKHNYYLIVHREDKYVSLKEFGPSICGKPLRLASEDDLDKFLGLKPGSVSTFGLLNDESRTVKLLMDEDFRGGRIGLHPNENTVTIFMAVDDLIKIIEEHGNPIEFVKF